MKPDLAAAMRRATEATRAGDTSAASRIIRDALSGHGPEDDRHSAAPGAAAAPDGFAGPTLDLSANGDSTAPGTRAGAPPRPEQWRRPRRPLDEVVQLLSRGGAVGLRPGPGSPGSRVPRAHVGVAEGAAFATRTFSCPAGARDYKLYRPASAPERPRALVVMLHGCQQDPDDFAVGTGMNDLAEAEGVLVAYPSQPGSANGAGCWNWFHPGHQTRNAGEPAIIAGITRELMDEFGLERDQVFVAGLSAGGAMAVVMGQTYPDLYAGVGAHSSLPYRAASDVVTAFAAMRGQAADRSRSPAATDHFRAPMRTIVFHGSADGTVHPSNGEMIANALVEAGAPAVSHGRSAGGRAYTIGVVSGAGGVPIMEHWIVDGAGHAWAGGSEAGSFTDPKGPDASREMLRFFLAGQA